jgi:hypothetical protein
MLFIDRNRKRNGMFNLLNKTTERTPKFKDEAIRPQRKEKITAPLPYRYTEVSLLYLLEELKGDSDRPHTLYSVSSRRRPFNSKFTYATNVTTGTKELVTQYYFQGHTVEIKSEGSSLLDFEHKNLFSIKGDVSLTELREVVIDYLNSTDRRRKHLNLPSVDSCADINKLKALVGAGPPKYLISPRKTAPAPAISYESILKNEQKILNLLQDKLIITTDATWEEPQRFRVRVEGNNTPSDLPSILMEIKKLSGRRGLELHLFFASPLPFWTDLKALLIDVNQLLVAEGLGYVIPGIPFQGTFLSLRFTTYKKEQERILKLLDSN